MRMVVVILASLAACYTPSHAPPPRPMPQAWGPPPTDDWHCAPLETQAARGSICFATVDRCEAERHQAEADGARSGPCRPQSPVSCFQLQADPSLSMEMCAATPEDCDLLRLIDQDRNGQTGGPCEWRHGPGLSR
jgi:hypothetical protein